MQRRSASSVLIKSLRAEVHHYVPCNKGPAPPDLPALGDSWGYK